MIADFQQLLTFCFSYNMDYDESSFVQPYCGLFHELQQRKLNNNVILPQFPYTNFDAGYGLYLFNCEKDHGYGSNSENDIVGTLELSGQFSKARPENLLFIIMISYENSYEIDIHRNVTFKDKSAKDTKIKTAKRFRL